MDGVPEQRGHVAHREHLPAHRPHRQRQPDARCEVARPRARREQHRVGGQRFPVDDHAPRPRALHQHTLHPRARPQRHPARRRAQGVGGGEALVVHPLVAAHEAGRGHLPGESGLEARERAPLQHLDAELAGQRPAQALAGGGQLGRAIHGIERARGHVLDVHAGERAELRHRFRIEPPALDGQAVER